MEPSTEQAPAPQTEADIQAPIIPEPIKPKNSKALVATTIACAILAVAGIAFGIYGMIQANNKSNEIAQLKVQIKNQDGTVTTLNTDEVKISDDKVIVVADSTEEDTEVRKLIEILQSTAENAST